MCQFSLPVQGDPLSLLQRAEHEITSKGGAFTGNDAQGSFRAKTPIGSIEGAYTVDGQQIILNITKKPFLLSCNKIERELRSLMK
jgi:hypothetical protein